MFFIKNLICLFRGHRWGKISTNHWPVWRCCMCNTKPDWWEDPTSIGDPIKIDHSQD